MNIFNKASAHRLEILTYAVVLIILGIVFSFKLGADALQSYDEAWYASISRNILRTHNPLKLEFNYQVFTDHPPMGFWIMSGTMLLFGDSEFGARLATALLGIGTIVVTYLIGWELKNRTVGLAASAMLISCLWFMVRARSANLDIQFVFWEVVSLFALIKLKKSPKFFYLLTVAFSALFLTKTLVGLGIVPAILYGAWVARKNMKLSLILKNVFLLVLIIAPWYVYNALISDDFLKHHFFEIGVRGGSNSFSSDSLQSSLNYLRIGVGKWYKVFIGSLALVPIAFIIKKDSREKFVYLLATLAGFALPLLLSSKTEIWHLIPLYPILAIVAAFTIQQATAIAFPKYSIVYRALVIGIVLLGVYQFRQFSNLIYPVGQPYSAEKDILLKAHQYPSLYIMEPFLPSAVYYADTKIYSFHTSQNAYQDLVITLESEEPVVFLVNETIKNDLERDEVNFTVEHSNDVFYLISNS